MKSMKVKITFTEELLGTAPADKEVYERWIASNAPDTESLREELESVPVDEVIDRSLTVFPRTENGKPCIYDYQVRGFFKEAAGFLKKAEVGKTAKLKAHKKMVDGLVFVKPRKIELKGTMNATCQRPLRASTAQGERIALANSEAMAPGTTAEFEIVCLNDDDMEYVREWLSYGEWHGIGQWRNSGKGSFVWEEIG